MNFTYTSTELPRPEIRQKPLNWQQPLSYPISLVHLEDVARFNPEDAAVLLRKMQPQVREQSLDSMEDRR